MTQENKYGRQEVCRHGRQEVQIQMGGSNTEALLDTFMLHIQGGKTNPGLDK